MNELLPEVLNALTIITKALTARNVPFMITNQDPTFVEFEIEDGDVYDFARILQDNGCGYPYMKRITDEDCKKRKEVGNKNKKIIIKLEFEPTIKIREI